MPSAEPSAAPARGRGQVAVVPSGAPDTGVAPASKSSGDLTTGLAGGGAAALVVGGAFVVVRRRRTTGV